MTIEPTDHVPRAMTFAMRAVDHAFALAQHAEGVDAEVAKKMRAAGARVADRYDEARDATGAAERLRVERDNTFAALDPILGLALQQLAALLPPSQVARLQVEAWAAADDRARFFVRRVGDMKGAPKVEAVYADVVVALERYDDARDALFDARINARLATERCVFDGQQLRLDVDRERRMLMVRQAPGSAVFAALSKMRVRTKPPAWTRAIASGMAS